METINAEIEAIQQGDFDSFLELTERFKPLVFSWLRKIHQLHTEQTEDYISMAKVILLECAKNYDKRRRVPFESYYKISLYNWYGNQMQKKKLACVSLNEMIGHEETPDLLEQLEQKNKILHLAQHMDKLSDQEQEILKHLMNGESAAEIGKLLHLSKKTILNKKYIIIKKMKIALQTH